ncbi:MAG: LytTR family transcriptional regulator [Bacteroidales bacterium]|jgi:hypothetical protein|nr:LytTR family transcriptional regulator [Bacteroidales bacterium]MDD4639778.1 LytTR family DNA-binding domain-containing protein [Bacteroidales bacterium]
MITQKVPSYLLQKNQMLGSLLFTILFSIIFLNIYTPFSSTAWFDLGKSNYFFFTVGVLAVSALILTLSRVLIYNSKKWFKLTYLGFFVWLFAEIVIIALLYTYVTVAFIEQTDAGYWSIFPRALLYTSVILIIPDTISILYCSLNDKNRTLRLLNYKDFVSDDELANKDKELIHLTDNYGNLRLSIKLDNLYYIESHDNYIKVYYMNKGAMANYLLRCKLKTIEESFANSSLMRCHRSYIINADKVKVIRKEKEGVYIDLDSDKVKSIPVSKGYSQKIMRYFGSDSV